MTPTNVGSGVEIQCGLVTKSLSDELLAICRNVHNTFLSNSRIPWWGLVVIAQPGDELSVQSVDPDGRKAPAQLLNVTSDLAENITTILQRHFREWRSRE